MRDEFERIVMNFDLSKLVIQNYMSLCVVRFCVPAKDDGSFRTLFKAAFLRRIEKQNTSVSERPTGHSNAHRSLNCANIT